MADGGGYCGILLAAGRSARFGADKRLHLLADGTPMALASARALKAALPRVAAVVEIGNSALCELLRAAGVELIPAPTSDQGVGTSLAAGIAATAQADGWVVALADMPFISASTIARVRAALAARAPIAAPCYQGRRGHPVGFDRRFRQALLALRGDEGARHLLHEHRLQVELIDCDDPGVVRDIDTPHDLCDSHT